MSFVAQMVGKSPSSTCQYQPPHHCYPPAPGLRQRGSLTSHDSPLNTQNCAQQTPPPPKLSPLWGKHFTFLTILHIPTALLHIYSSSTFSLLIGIENWNHHPKWPEQAKGQQTGTSSRTFFSPLSCLAHHGLPCHSMATLTPPPHLKPCSCVFIGTLTHDAGNKSINLC